MRGCVYVWTVLTASMLLYSTAAEELAVNITVSYTPPPGFIPGPDEYRAASGPVTVTCTAVGGAGTVNYQWSSTCRDCPFYNASSSSVLRAAVHSGDTGNHTCTATNGSITGSTTSSFNVVGAGIHVFIGVSPGSLPNNGIIISLNMASNGFRFRFFCRSDSMMSNTGILIGPDNTTVTTENVGNVFDIAHPQPGELRVQNSPNSLTARDQGVYTCRIPLQSGQTRDINIGIYPSGFNAPPKITHLEFTSGQASTLICSSTGSPATTVTWMRDGEPLTIDGSTYQLTQTVTNRTESTYNNMLTINTGTISDVDGPSYTCIVANALGMDNRTYPPPTVTISPPGTPTAGQPFSLTCTVTLAKGDSLNGNLLWTAPSRVDVRETMTKDSSVTYTSMLELNPVRTSHGGQYTCQATSTAGTVMDAKILTVQIAPPITTMRRDPDANVTLRHGDNLTLTCTIQLDPDLTVESDVVVTGSITGRARSNSTPVMTSAGIYKITLYIAALQATARDPYTCVSIVEPRSEVMYVSRSEPSTASLDITVELVVNIRVSYTPPPGFILGPNEYRAASGPMTVTCTAVGGTGSLTYQWSSTCRNCPFRSNTSSMITRPSVHFGDTGNYTCTVTNGSRTGSTTRSFNVVGAGIHVFIGVSPGSLPNNGIIISLNTARNGFLFRFFCRSDSMMDNTGMLIGLDNTIVTTENVFDIAHPQPGELRVENSPNSLTARDQGVYTCRIPLQSGQTRDINIGIYPSGFNAPPSITHLRFTHGPMSSNLICISTGSPATTVTWRRDGQSLTIDGSTYQLTQTVTNRSLSTYENVLTINAATSDNEHTYNCTIINALGKVSKTLTAYPLPIVTISPPEIPIAGEPFSLTCTVTLAEGDSLIGDPTVQWITPNGISDIQQVVTNDSTVTYTSALKFNPVHTSDGGQYTCQATSTVGTVMNAGILTVQIPPPTISVSRDPDASVTIRQGDTLTLICTIQLDPDQAVDIDVVVTGKLQGPAGMNSAPMMTSDGVYTMTLRIASLQATALDTYTCTSSVGPQSGVMYVTGSESHYSLNITVEQDVSIIVSYTPPPGTELNSNQYRAASGPVTVTCTAVGITGALSYQWSSTCRDCPFQSATSRSIHRGAVHSGDTGIHTCTATSDSGTGSTSINFYVVGAGIHVFKGASTGNLQVPGSLQNNGLVISLDTMNDFNFQFFCRSDSMMENTGMLIGLDGTTITASDIFDIAHPQPGELRVQNSPSLDILTVRDQGVYTCHIPLQSGEMRDINIGIYPSGFNTSPKITHLGFTHGPTSSNLTCISTGSPATTVTWMRDGQPLSLNGITYHLTQTVTNRTLSTYKNVLFINTTTSDVIEHNYTCTIINALGTVSKTLRAYPLPIVTILPPEMSIVGEPFSLTCTVTLAEGDSLIGDPIIRWIAPNGVSDIQQVMTNDSTVTYTSTLELNPVDTSHGGEYTCQVTSTAGTIMDAKILTVQTLCPEPADILNGMVTFTENSVGDTATYTCSSGFELIGSTTTTCTQVDINSAAFTPPPPVCRRSSSSSVSAGAVGGAVAGVLIVVLIVIIIVVAACWLKRHGKLHLQPHPKWPSTMASFELTDAGKDEVENVKQTTSSVHSKSEGISVASFSAHVSHMHANKDRGFQSEYESIGKEPLATRDAAKISCNKERNRFANIYPYDFCRVKLKEIKGEEGSDYINASFIEGYTQQNEYVASQGPIPETVGDFWRMIWEHKLTTIAMLTRCNEGGKKKCQQYWPEMVNGTEEVGYNLAVTLTSLLPFAEYEIRTLTVKDTSDPKEPALEVTHFFYQAWPDHGVPLNAISLIAFIRRVRQSHPPSHPRPLLVHCSAGVGRTGTFMVIDIEMQRIKDTGVVNASACLKRLRSQRVQMVQTLTQYMFIHDALDELIACGETDISATNLRIITSQLRETAIGKQVSGFQDQFELLEQVSPKTKKEDFANATAKYNLSKNRYASKVAGNKCRVFLRNTDVEGSDYINANFVNGYRKSGAYIATQGPLASTVKDFWQMIWEYQSKCIVMLCGFEEEGEESCYPYWPTNQGMATKYHNVGVTLQSEEKHRACIVRKFEVFGGKSKSTDETRLPAPFIVTQFQFLRWPKNSCPSPPSVLLEVMENVNRVQMTTGNKAITVMCNDGMGRTGAFICLHAQLERLKTEGVIDCFQFIKSARLNRPGLVQNVEQYILCHEVLLDFVDSFETYSNFKEVV